jgi:hypothetical protein
MVLLRRRIGLWPKAQPTRTAEATAVLREVCRKLSWVVGGISWHPKADFGQQKCGKPHVNPW